MTEAEATRTTPRYLKFVLIVQAATALAIVGAWWLGLAVSWDKIQFPAAIAFAIAGLALAFMEHASKRASAVIAVVMGIGVGTLLVTVILEVKAASVQSLWLWVLMIL